MLKHLKYLKCLLLHKYYVFVECYKAGIVYRGLVHDLSKFLPSEWFPYVEHFYGANKNKDKFDKAWKLHIKRNSHHTAHHENGVMSDEDIVEMLCDWVGAGKAYKNATSIYEWYKSHNYAVLQTLSFNDKAKIDTILTNKMDYDKIWKYLKKCRRIGL